MTSLGRSYGTFQKAIQRWGTVHTTIRRALDDFTHSGPVDHAVLSAAQAVERAARRVDRVGLSYK